MAHTLKTNEIEHQTIWCIQRVQQEADKRGEIEGVKVLLNLQLNDTGVLESRGRTVGQYPIFFQKKQRIYSTMEWLQPWNESENDIGYQSYVEW